MTPRTGGYRPAANICKTGVRTEIGADSVPVGDTSQKSPQRDVVFNIGLTPKGETAKYLTQARTGPT